MNFYLRPCDLSSLKVVYSDVYLCERTARCGCVHARMSVQRGEVRARTHVRTVRTQRAGWLRSELCRFKLNDYAYLVWRFAFYKTFVELYLNAL